jgi:hypothetical protein
MSGKTYIGPISSGRLLRKVGVFFLLFVCLDIAFPPPFAQGSECLSASNEVVTAMINHMSVERALGGYILAE